MLRIISYYLIGGLIAFGLFFVYYKYGLRNSDTKKLNAVMKQTAGLGIVKVVLAYLFLSMYFSNAAPFSSQRRI